MAAIGAEGSTPCTVTGRKRAPDGSSIRTGYPSPTVGAVTPFTGSLKATP